jgi:hypothetical protein
LLEKGVRQDSINCYSHITLCRLNHPRRSLKSPQLLIFLHKLLDSQSFLNKVVLQSAHNVRELEYQFAVILLLSIELLTLFDSCHLGLRILIAYNLLSLKLEVFTVLSNYLIAFHWTVASIDYETILATHLIDHYRILEPRLGTHRPPRDRVAIVPVEVHIPTSIRVHSLLERGPPISLGLGEDLHTCIGEVGVISLSIHLILVVVGYTCER